MNRHGTIGLAEPGIFVDVAGGRLDLLLAAILALRDEISVGPLLVIGFYLRHDQLHGLRLISKLVIQLRAKKLPYKIRYSYRGPVFRKRL